MHPLQREKEYCADTDEEEKMESYADMKMCTVYHERRIEGNGLLMTRRHECSNTA